MWIVCRGNETACKLLRQRIQPKRSKGHCRPWRDQGFQGKGKVGDARPTSKPFVVQFANTPLSIVHLLHASCRCLQVPIWKPKFQKRTSLVLHTRSRDRGLCVFPYTCCEVFPEDASVLGLLPALSLYSSDPLSSPPLSQRWKREESKALPIFDESHVAIGS